MTFRFICTSCNRTARAEISFCPPWLSPIALALNSIARKNGWVYRNGRIGKSVVSVICFSCRPPRLDLEADYSPVDVVPGTYEDDVCSQS